MHPNRLTIFKRTKYWQETNAIIIQCCAVAEKKGLSIGAFALLCDLSPVTVRANLEGMIGLPQQLTLWKLCAGANFKLEILGRPSRNGLHIESEMSDIRKALKRQPKKRGKKRKAKRRA